MNQKNIVKLLYVYGAMLILTGVLTYLSDENHGSAALVGCSFFGVLSLAWGFLVKYGIPHAIRTATISTGILIIVFTWYAALGWQEFFQEESGRILSGAMMTLLMPATIVLFLFLNNARQVSVENA